MNKIGVRGVVIGVLIGVACCLLFLNLTGVPATAAEGMLSVANGPTTGHRWGSDLIESSVTIALIALAMALLYRQAKKRTAGIKAVPSVEPDEEPVAVIFAKRDVFFGSAHDMEGRLVLSTKRLRYIGFDTQKTLLSVGLEDVLSISCKRHKVAIKFKASRGRKECRKYKLLSEASTGDTRIPSETSIEAFQQAVTQWVQTERH